MVESKSSPGAALQAVVLRLFFFLLLEMVGLVLFSTLLDELFGRLVAGALGTFLAAALANALTVRIFERGRLEDVGMGWSRDAKRHLFSGFGLGALAALAVMGALWAGGWGRIMPALEAPFGLGRLLWVSVLLLFGAVGEELLFRGYGFQVIMARAGAVWVIPVSSLIFAWMHKDNPAAGWVALLNTGLWGVVLGFAYYRARDLWLPIGLHFGWNWAMPLLGANLSGFTMGLTGIHMEARGSALWSGGSYGPEGSLLTTIVAVALSLWLWRSTASGEGDHEGGSVHSDAGGGEPERADGQAGSGA